MISVSALEVLRLAQTGPAAGTLPAWEGYELGAAFVRHHPRHQEGTSRSMAGKTSETRGYWRTRHNSNVRPSPSEGNSWGLRRFVATTMGLQGPLLYLCFLLLTFAYVC